MPVYNDVMMPAMIYGDPMAGQESESLLSAVLPGPIQAMSLGIASANQKTGLRTRGLFGYSTIFTGTGAESSLARRMSLGRLGLGMVSAAAQGVQGLTNVRPNTTMGRLMSSLGGINETGIAGAYAGWRTESYRPTASSRMTVIGGERSLMVRVGEETYIRGEQGRWQMRNRKRGGYAAMPTVKKLPREVRQFITGSQQLSLDDAAAAIGGRIETANRAGRVEHQKKAVDALKKDKVFRTLAGFFGGVDVTDGAAERNILFKDDSIRLRTDRNAPGHLISNSRWGRAAGGIVRGAVALELLSLLGDGAVHAVGSGYGALARVSNEMSSRFNPNTMSQGYFNQAASTERQRALQELNTSVLNPRSQLMGNEAFYYHR